MDYPSPNGPVALGVDFGTSHTVAVLGRSGDRIRPLLFDGSPLLPSAVCADDDGVLITGRDAVRAGVRRPELIEPNPKRRIDEDSILLGEREFTVGETFAAVLARVREEAVRVAGHLDRVTLTVPATWGGPRRRKLTDAALAVGMPDRRLAVEPVAAAVYFTETLDHLVPVGSAVVIPDFGAGTFDVSVVARTDQGFEVLAVDGRDDLGGLDIDAAMVNYLGEQLGRRPEWRRLTDPVTETDRRQRLALLEEVRIGKEQLSRQQRADILVPLLEVSAHLTRGELEEVVTPLIARAVDITGQAIRASGLPRERIAGVFLVGGASRMPLVSTMLHRGLGVAPTVLEQPELVVAEGSLRLGDQTPTVPIPVATPPRPAPSPPAAPAPAPEPTRALEAEPTAATVPFPAVEPEPRRRRTRKVVTIGALSLVAVVAAGLTIWLNPANGGTSDNAGRQDPKEQAAPSLYEAGFFSGGDDVLQMWNVEEGTRVGNAITGHEGIVFAADLTQIGDDPVLVSGGQDGHVRTWHAETGEPLKAYPVHEGNVGALVATEIDDIPIVISAANDDRAVVTDLSTGEEIEVFDDHTDDVRAVAVVRLDGEPVAVTASSDGTVRVWDPLTGMAVRDPFEGHGNAKLRALDVGIVGDQLVVLSGGTDRRLISWYLDTGREIESYDDHEGAVRAAAMIETANGTVALSAGDGQTIIISNPETGEEIGRLEGHTDSIFSMEVDARAEAGTRVISGDKSGIIRIWDLEEGEELHEISADHGLVQTIVVP